MKRFPSIVVGALVLSGAAFAAERPIDDINAGTLTIYFENDLFVGTDRYYTNGTKISWTSPDLEKFSGSPFAQPFMPVLRSIPYINNPDMQKNVAISIGQNMYTPDNTEATELVENDRPYAGWLYAGLGLVWKDFITRNSLVLNIGVVGPWSFAEETQRLVHEARQIDVPRGWDNQLHNELGIALAYERTWRLWPDSERVGFGYDVLPFAGVTVGNVQTSAQVGGEARVGFNLPDDFGTATISPSATTPTSPEREQAARRPRRFDLGAYIFVRGEGRLVAHNIFLDGNTFGDSPSVDRNWLVGDVSAGASVNYKNTKLTYAMVLRSKEFEGQEEAQLFGAISLNFAF
jgi:lipid A 3-O-deacylase